MKEAVGEIWGSEAADCGDDVDEEDAGEVDEVSDGEDCLSQPLDVNSEEMRPRIIESGTRLPDCIAASACTPGKSISR